MAAATPLAAAEIPRRAMSSSTLAGHESKMTPRSLERRSRRGGLCCASCSASRARHVPENRKPAFEKTWAITFRSLSPSPLSDKRASRARESTESAARDPRGGRRTAARGGLAVRVSYPRA